MTTETHQTSCPLDCPDACSLEVTTAKGKLSSLSATDDNPYTQGFICSKVRRIDRHVSGEHRLLHPARRTGPRGPGATFEPISWDEALDLLEQRFRALSQQNSEGILPLSYGGSNGLLSQDTYDQRLFHHLGASRLARTVCAAPSTEAATGLYGRMAGVALDDHVHAKLIVVWGTNPSDTGIHYIPVLEQAKKNGARVVVIDPRRTGTAVRADLHLAPRPGTDLVLALSILRFLFEEGHADREFLEQHTTGAAELERRCAPWTFERAAQVCDIDASQLEQFAREFAAASPAVIRCGWGVERNRNGGSAIAAILALPAVAGKFGVRGGGYTMSNGGAFRLATANPGLGGNGKTPRTINMNLVGQELQHGAPPVEMLFVYNNNPVATLPEQNKVLSGLERDDLFTVVFEQVHTESVDYADLVLPATTFLEHHDLRKSYGTMLIQKVTPAIDARGEARSNLWLFWELCRRFSLLSEEEALDTTDEARARRLSKRMLQFEPGGFDRLEATGRTQPSTGSHPVQFQDVFPKTQDNLVHLVPEAQEQDARSANGTGLYAFQDTSELTQNGKFPLALISPSTHRTISSTFGQFERGVARLVMHPDDASSRGLAEDQAVRVFNDSGEVHCDLDVNTETRPGTVVLPKGLWLKSTRNQRTSNALSPDHLADLGGGACFNDARVEVEAIGDPA